MMLSSVILWVVANLGHVTGHLLAARLFGVAVNRVSLGIGPTLWKRELGATTFRVALLPVAFLVRLRRRWTKQDPDWRSDDPRDLRNKSALTRLCVILAAPAVLALLALLAAYHQAGLPRPTISEAPLVRPLPGRPAAEAGLRSGDRVLSVSNTPVARWSELRGLIEASRGEALLFEVSRRGQRLRIEVRPERIEGTERWVVGIVQPTVVQIEQPVAPWARVGVAFDIVADNLSVMGRGAWTVLSGELSPPRDTVAGPVAIVREVGSDPRDPRTRAATERYRFGVSLTRVLVHYLVLCLLPFIPYLDGRRLLFWGIEAAWRRTLHPRFEQWYNRIALLVLCVLLALAFFNDLARYLAG